jgi:hypothetical protein
MQGGRGIAVGFVAGLLVSGAAVLLFRDGDATSPSAESNQLIALTEQIQRLERAVARSSGGAASSPRDPETGSPAADVSEPPLSPAQQAAEERRRVEQQQAFAAADAMVDQLIQSGQMSREQSVSLNAAIERLSRDEQGRILARVSAAINRDELQVELP